MKPVRNDDVLGCWQEIADYLERSVRTCQRWSKTRGLPVYFPAGEGTSPYASKAALDAWRFGASRLYREGAKETQSPRRDF
ncbi:hypothetical protein K8I61_04235 [bacterium]|nr:hypothetical protein [bacterium]